MSDMLLKMPLQYEPLRKNRWILRFPADLGIQEWYVASANRPGVSNNPKPIPFLNTETYVAGRYVWDEIREFIGDCGITIQDIDGELLPEIGYHINKKFWRKGFAKEAAKAVRDWGFLNTQYDIIYSYMKYTNVGSYSTAIANGMQKVKEYPDPKNTISYAYAITREKWNKIKES